MIYTLQRFSSDKHTFLALVVGLLFCSIGAIADEVDFADELSEAVVGDTAAEEPAAIEDVPVAAMPKAENIDLDKPVLTESAAPEPTTAEPAEAETKSEAPVVTTSPAIAAEPEVAKSLVLLGKEIQPGIATRLPWAPMHSFEGVATPTPVLVAHGNEPGPVLCLTASIHGDELNGIEIVRRVLYNLEVDKLSGTVIGVPIVNLQGFHRASRYLTDRRDLNRYFPGDPHGSSAARIAYSFFNQVVKHCDALVDLHTGSFHRTNLPQLRADLTRPEVVELTHGFGATVVLHSDAAPGTLRAAAVEAGIPAVTLEAGGPMELQEDAVSHGVKGIQTLLNKMGMQKKTRFWGDPEPVYYQSVWVRANQGGILFSKVKLGERVKKGSVLGVVTNPITNVKDELVSPNNGRILGMAVNQVVQPGFAAFRVGIQKEEDKVVPDKEPALEGIGPPAMPPAQPQDTEEEPDLAAQDVHDDPDLVIEASE